jgi:hypothetical protein
MHSQNRSALSSALAVLVAVVVVGAAAGIYFFSSASPSVIASSTSTSSSFQASTHITSSHSGTETVTVSPTTTTSVPTHITSVHSGTETVTASQTVTSTTSGVVVSQAGPPTLVFGIAGTGGNVTVNIPANTLTWTSWVTNTTLTGPVEQTLFEITPQNVNSTLTMAVYVNGVLAGNTSYTVPPAAPPPPGHTASGSDFEAEYSTGVGGQTVIPAGSTVSIAVLCSTPLAAYSVNGGQSFEASSTSIPAQLPSSPTTVTGTVLSGGYVE